jgi:hypothetical protein
VANIRYCDMGILGVFTVLAGFVYNMMYLVLSALMILSLDSYYLCLVRIFHVLAIVCTDLGFN